MWRLAELPESFHIYLLKLRKPGENRGNYKDWCLKLISRNETNTPATPISPKNSSLDAPHTSSAHLENGSESEEAATRPLIEDAISSKVYSTQAVIAEEVLVEALQYNPQLN